MKKIAIHQPQYFPWIPYFNKIISSDVFVLLDTVDFSKNGVQNRNKILSRNGDLWITVPVKQKIGQKILDTPIADSRIFLKHWKTIQMSYSKTPGFIRYNLSLEELLLATLPKMKFLSEVNVATIKWVLSTLDIQNTDVVLASMLPSFEQTKNDLVVSICKHFEAKTYLSGSGAINYMDKDKFNLINCDILIQNIVNVPYNQNRFLFPEFYPNLSILDLMFNAPDEAHSIINNSATWEKWL
jgi:hypothetical protein